MQRLTFPLPQRLAVSFFYHGNLCPAPDQRTVNRFYFFRRLHLRLRFLPAVTAKRPLVRDSLLFSLESPRISQKHLVPAAAVRLMKRRVLSRPGVNSLMSSLAWSGNLGIEPHELVCLLVQRQINLFLAIMLDFSFSFHWPSAPTKID